jgi:DNA-binding beta-propeller fold protein YncE
MKLASNGAVIHSVSVGTAPTTPTFDGTNIWVPNSTSNTVSVVRASSGIVLTTLSGNGLNTPTSAAFDGERILVTNNGGHSVSLWKATDLTPIGTFSTGANSEPIGACSDGLNFWITLAGTGKVARF